MTEPAPAGNPDTSPGWYRPSAQQLQRRINRALAVIRGSGLDPAVARRLVDALTGQDGPRRAHGGGR